MSTYLYEQYILADDGPHSDLMRRVWAGTPWVIDVFTGRGERPDREYAILTWLSDNMGDQAWPLGKSPRAGRWLRGSATINGYTWFGFADPDDMQAFLKAWPSSGDDGSATAPADGDKA